MELGCEVEYQVADAGNGRNLRTTLYRRALLCLRKGGVQLHSDTPTVKKALRMARDTYEIYSSRIHEGRLTLITRDGMRIHQYNVREAVPQELLKLKDFSVRCGAISRTPQCQQPRMARVKTQPHSLKRPRLALQDLTNDIQPPNSSSSSRAQFSLDNVKKPRSQIDQLSSASPQLSQDQQRVLSAVFKERANVFFTGCAGTGKSFLLKRILERAQRIKRVYGAATTGIAAFNIGGMTLHHFAGMDSRPYNSPKALLSLIKQRRDAVARWKQVEMLIIDEVSMLDGQLFDDLEFVARQIRGCNSFFGGIQLVLCGDFYQLPPVTTSSNSSCLLCFQSKAWQLGIHRIFELRHVFRQSNEEFVDLLNAFRVGKPTPAMVDLLNARTLDKLDSCDVPADAIQILTHNLDVMRINNERLEQLEGRKYVFSSVDRGNKALLSACPAPRQLTLKLGAQVMLTKTISAASGLVNGLRGVIKEFQFPEGLPRVRFANGVTRVIAFEEFSVRPVAEHQQSLASRQQLPLTLAWAISIHKSQGLSFETAVLDLSRVFEYGQAYVALSRVKSLEGLWLRKPLASWRLPLLANPEIDMFYSSVP